MDKLKFKDIGESILTPEVLSNKVRVVMDIIGSEEQTTQYLNANNLRRLANYLDSRTKPKTKC